MPIISISLNEDIIKDVNRLQKIMGFSGRSEIVRAGLRSMVAEQREREDIVENVSALLLVIHDEENDYQATQMRHDYEGVINTHLHSKIDRDRCVEVFLLKGDAVLIKEMTKKFQINKKLDHVKLIAM